MFGEFSMIERGGLVVVKQGTVLIVALCDGSQTREFNCPAIIKCSF